MPEFHAEAPRPPASEGLALGPYVAARAGIEPTTLWLKVIVSTKAPPRPTIGTWIRIVHSKLWTVYFAHSAVVLCEVSST